MIFLNILIEFLENFKKLLISEDPEDKLSALEELKEQEF